MITTVLHFIHSIACDSGKKSLSYQLRSGAECCQCGEFVSVLRCHRFHIQCQGDVSYEKGTRLFCTCVHSNKKTDGERLMINER